MEPQEDFERFFERYADLNVHEAARWSGSVAKLLARLKRSNLAIVALVAVSYTSLPMSIMLALIGAITLLGIVGGFRDG
ncbi:hypothetical protein [Burkholderia gladioli]|uniref:hypothetical protein n=1 Tax=Burkholderia gladioli TaxID=28095 RepID=UPI00163FCAD3|nr:hypothetical protein [Burkholderia gladioli]